MSTSNVPSWTRDLDHLDALSEAVLVTDLTGALVFTNASARRRYQLAGHDGGPPTLAGSLLPDIETDLFEEISRQVLAGGSWSGRLHVREVDGSVREADVTCSPLTRDGTVTGQLCVVDDTSGARSASHRTRRLEDRLARLARVAAALGAATDVESVTEVVIAQAADAVGATVASLSVLVDDDTLALVGLRGGVAGAARRWARFPVSASTPAGDVVCSGKLLVIVGAEEIAARYPHLERASEGSRTLVALPLKVLGTTLGAITLSFPGRRQLDAAELEFFGILADSCAQALERLRARDAADVQAARVRFLASASTELASSLDYGRTLTAVARLAVPTFADWCAIDLLEDGRLHRLAVEHVDPTKKQVAHDLADRYPSHPDQPNGAWEVIRTRTGMLMSEIRDEVLVAAAQDEQHLALMRELELRSVVQVPLIARSRALGVITWVTAESERRYTHSDLEFAEELGQRCAVAIDNAQLYSETMEAAVRLQDAVLPDLSAGVRGWELAHLYSPAGRTEVGGDFYDAIELPDGRLALFVGDVMGRGVSAAAAMAQVRASIRAYLAVDPTPAVVLRKLDLLFTTYGMSQLVTLVFLVADPERRELQVINAGHPPPVILRADGRVEQLPLADGPPLGVRGDGRGARSVPFTRGDAVIAFTDGLIERRDEDIDAGQRRLLQAVPDLAAGRLGQTLPLLVEAVRDHTREDDVAVLVARWSTDGTHGRGLSSDGPE